MPVYAINKQGRFNYELLDNFEAGLVLTGAEVKSVKANKINLKGSYISHENDQLWLKKAHISPYQQKNQPDYDPERPRKILMKRQEIDSLMGKHKSEGLTIIPEKVYNKGGLIKVQIALARGKKARDKRDTIKKRESDRKARRAMRAKV